MLEFSCRKVYLNLNKMTRARRTDKHGQKCMYAMHHHAVAQFNVSMEAKDGAYMVESEIEAFNMYECLREARWLVPHISHDHLFLRDYASFYVKASIFVSHKIREHDRPRRLHNLAP